MSTWQIHDAKARFSEVVRMAETEPQFVTMRGCPAVVIVSQQEYLKLRNHKPPFLELMQNSPWADAEIEIERDRSEPRDVCL